MIAKCVSDSTDVVEFYIYKTEQVVKFTPDSSNKLSLHTTAGNTIWETDTNGVLFNTLTLPAATSFTLKPVWQKITLDLHQGRRRNRYKSFWVE